MVSPIQAYKNTASLLQNLDMNINDTPQSQPAKGGSFGDVLGSMLKGTMSSLRGSEALAMKSVTGQVDQIALSTAQNEADLALKTAVASIKACLNALHEINQMGI